MIDQLEIEKKWQKRWKEQKTFTPRVDSSKEKYFGTVPYPYANSALHIGHGRTFVFADIFLRYQRLLGKQVLYPLAFHISGTPVLAVADGIAKGDKKTIELVSQAVASYESSEDVDKVVSSFTSSQAIADYFSSKIETTFASVGLGMDFSKTFSTGDEAYQRFISWKFRLLEEKGLLTKGSYPILYSPLDESAVGEDDIKDGDTDKVTLQEMTYVLFKSTEQDEYFCVATLRPDALFGTTNLWVDPEHILCRVKVGDQQWIINSAAFEKINHQFSSVELIEQFSGEQLLGKTFITPFTQKEILVAQASFIDKSQGTGLVYSSPAGSPHDYMALEEAKKDGRLPASIQPISTVMLREKNRDLTSAKTTCFAQDLCEKKGITSSSDPRLEEAKKELYKLEHYSGVLTDACAQFSGIPIKKAKQQVVQALEEQHLGGVLYETSRPATTRSGNPVIVANLDGQWFLDYTGSREKALALLEEMHYYPSSLKKTQQGYLEWVEKRPCARKRGLGTPLPQDPEWIVEPLSDSTIYSLFYIVAGMIQRGDLTAEDCTDELFNYFYFNAPKPDLEGVEKLKEEVDYWKNFDFRYTAPPHMSNHLSFLIYHNAVLFEGTEFLPDAIAVGGLLIKDGHKISKSKGNGIPLIRVRELYGADLYRLYVAVGASFDAEMDFRDEEIHHLEKKFHRLKELLFLAKELPTPSFLEPIDKWLQSRFYSRAKDFFSHADTLQIREGYVSLVYEFMHEINYHTRRTSQEQTLNVLQTIYKDYALLLTPVIPHVAEEVLDGAASLQAFTTSCESFISKDVEAQEEMVMNLLADIDRLLQFKQSKNESVDSLEVFTAPSQRYELFDVLAGLLEKKTPPKEIMSILFSQFPDEGQLIKKFVPKTFGSGIHPYFSPEQEQELLSSLIPFLEKEYGVTVSLIQPQQLAKPGVFGVRTV